MVDKEKSAVMASRPCFQAQPLLSPQRKTKKAKDIEEKTRGWFIDVLDEERTSSKPDLRAL
jgi:hypothetical protein